MADWRTYAKAARNTARKQAPGARRAVEETARRSAERAGVYARAARTAADEGTRESRGQLRRDADQWRRRSSAAVTVAGRRAQKAQIGKRFLAAVRDALIMGAALFAIWFVVTRTGVQIPFQVVIGVVLAVMVLRFGWALYAQFAPHRHADDEQYGPDDDQYGPDDAPDRADGEHRR